MPSPAKKNQRASRPTLSPRRYRQLAPSLLALILFLSTLPVRASDEPAEVSDQLWFNYILAFPRSQKLYMEVDFEAAAEVSGDEPWRYLYTTGLVEYYITDYIDLTGELLSGVTQQDSGEDSLELAGRFGFRLHLLAPFLSYLQWERLPGGRVGLANLARVEPRKFWYNSDRGSESDVRMRNRIELRAAINKANMGMDGVWIFLTDWEWFWEIGGNAPAERFSTKTRWRIGLDYRHSYSWRYSLLLQRDQARDTREESFDIDAYMVDLRIKMFF